jgi:hypothetical protein
MPLPIWKPSSGSKNFVDYYDCRPCLTHPWLNPSHFNFYEEILLLVKKFFNCNTARIRNSLFEFNFYKNIKKGLSNNLQFFPHSDGTTFNCIIYFDTVSSGGTALYPEIKYLENTERSNLLYDVSKFKRTIIPARPNRLVIFDGSVYHGGFIENHNSYVSNWRKNQVIFLTY